MKINTLILTASLGLATAAPSARAEFVFATDPSGAWGGASPNMTIGTPFSVGSTAITVSSLGFFDHYGTGLAQAHEVGIYDHSRSLLGSVVVPSGTGADAYHDGTRWMTLGLPIALNANTSYTLAFTMKEGGDQASGSGPSQVVISPLFALAGSSWTYAVGPSLAYPGGDPLDSIYAFGGNMAGEATPVPEPGQWAMMGLTALGVAAYSARRFGPKRIWVSQQQRNKANMKINTFILTASLGLAATPGAWAQVILSDNLANTSAGRSMNTGSGWSAAKFTTDAQPYKLTSAVLLMSGFASPVAQADVYSDSGANKPGVSLGALVSPGSFSPGLEQKTFTSSGIALAANSSYWVVLQATSGALGWSYTQNPSGTGAGFVTYESDTTDAGANWYTAIFPPYQMRVNASAVPEPGQWAMMAVTALGLAGYAARRVRAKANVG